MSNITILVVDDESRMRKLVKDFLIQKDFKVIEAENGEIAIKIFEENKEKIDLILLDVMMPKLDGWSVLRQIRQKMIQSHLPSTGARLTMAAFLIASASIFLIR